MGIIKREKKPSAPYVHQEYPKYLYRRTAAGAVVSQLVNSKDEHEAIRDAGWVESPADTVADRPKTSEVDDESLAALLDENEQLKARLAALEGGDTVEEQPAPAPKVKKGKG